MKVAATLLFVLPIVNANTVPTHILYPGKYMIDRYDSVWTEANKNNYLVNSQHGYSISGNKEYMATGCGPMTVGNNVMMYKFNQATDTYDEIVNDRNVWFTAGSALEMADDYNNYAASQDGSSGSYAVMVDGTSFQFSSLKNLPTGSKSCDHANFPCDSVAVSRNSRFWLAGWPTYTEGTGVNAQNGFVRAYTSTTSTTTATISALSEAWDDGSYVGAPWVVARGRDPLSRYGSSVSLADMDATGNYLFVGGAPGNTAQKNGQEYPSRDFGGNDGDHRYGGYVMVNSIEANAARVLSRFWAPDGNTTEAVDNKFGAIVRLVPDGSKLLVTAPGTTVDGVTRGAFYIYENVYDGYDGRDGFSLFRGPFFGPGENERFGWSAFITPDGNEVFIGAPHANSGDGKVYRYSFINGDYVQTDTFVDETNGLGGNLGHSVWFDSSRNKLYAGAPQGTSYSSYTNIGKINVFDVPLSGSPVANWKQISDEFEIESTVEERHGGSVAISNDGSVIAYGSPFAKLGGTGNQVGRVTVWQRDGTSYTLMGDPIELSTGGTLGTSLAMSYDGLTIATATLPGNRGKVHVFRFIDGQWTQLGSQIVQNETPNVSDGFGSRLSISADGNVLVISAWPYSSSNGLVQVYEFDGTEWVQRGQTLLGTNAERLGASVSISADGNRIVVGLSNFQNGATLGAGAIDVYDFINGQWTAVGSRLLGTLTYQGFGWRATISGDGTTICDSKLSGSANQKTKCYRINDGEWYQLGQTIAPLVNGDAVSLSYDGNVLVLARLNEFSNRGMVHTFEFNGIKWVYTKGILTGIKNAEEFGYSVALSPNGYNLIVGAWTWTPEGSTQKVGRIATFSVSAPPTAAPTVDPGNPTRRPTRFPTFSPTKSPTPQPTVSPTTSPTVTPPCETSEDCAAWPERICDKAVMGCVRVPCVGHGDCFDRTLLGRLPFCEPKTRRCIDTRNSTCTQALTCLSAANTALTQTNAISKTSLAVREPDSTKRAAAAQQTMESVRNASSSASLTVSAEESMTMPALANLTVEELMEAVKLERCGSVAELCTVSTSSRRMLDEGDVTFTVQYDLDEDIYNQLIANGTNFNDPSFASSIALSLGVDPANVTVTDNGGVIEVQITIVDVSEEGTPIEAEVLSEIQSISSQLSNITSQVASNLGIDTSSFDEPVVDLCGSGRTCSNRGTCDSATGLCTCNSPAYYGLNCELVTAAPTLSPSASPTFRPTASPTFRPTQFPTKPPTPPPTPHPTGEFPHDTVGFSSVTLNIKNFTSLSSAVLSLRDAVKNDTMRFTFSGTQRFTFPLEVYNVDPDEGFIKGAIEAMRGCPSRICTTTFQPSFRRMLSSNGEVIVEVSYTLSEESFENFINNGDDFTTERFARRLESELGLAEGTVSVFTISNSITVEVEVISTPQDSLPTTPEVFQLLLDTKALLDAQADVVFGVFGITGDTVLKTTLNLCLGRETCGGHGTCNTETGICACEIGFLGINCQTPCVCENGGNCDTGKCQCHFPFYGVLCEQTKDECVACSS